MRRLLFAAALVAAALSAPDARASVVTRVLIPDAAGDAYAYVYGVPDRVQPPPEPQLSDPSYDLLSTEVRSTPRGVAITVRTAGPVDIRQELVWVHLIPASGLCRLAVRVSDFPTPRGNTTQAAVYCTGNLQGYVGVPDRPDPSATTLTAWLPYSAFPSAVPPRGDVGLHVEADRAVDVASVQLCTCQVDTARSTDRLRLHPGH